MDSRLFDADELSLSRKSRIPGRGFFQHEETFPGESIMDEKQVEDHQVAIIADPDPDGLACVALIREIVDDCLYFPAGPHELIDTLELLSSHTHDDLSVYICDLAPDSVDDIDEVIHSLTDAAASVRWYDHHQWPADAEALVNAAGVDLLLGDSDSECTADVALRGLDSQFPDHLVALTEVTRDHDLWIKDDPRSDDLADYCHWVEPAEYVATIIEHGPDLPADAQELLTERRQEKQALIDLAVDRARFVEIETIRVGITYGRCSQNEVAEALRQDGADAAVIVKPAGSVSIRGSETFQRCHEVAGRLGGGGHPRAAGCKPDIYHDVLDYAYHWVTEGAITQRTVLDAFDSVLGSDR